MGTQDYYISPLCVPRKGLLPVESEARSQAIEFFYSLRHKAQSSVDFLEIRGAKKTRLLTPCRRLSQRTKQVLESSLSLDLASSDSSNFCYLENCFGDLIRLRSALEMFSNAEMNSKTGRRMDGTTLDALLMRRDAEEASEQIQMVFENAKNARKQTPGFRKTEIHIPYTVTDRSRLATDKLYIEISDMLAPKELSIPRARRGGIATR